MKSKFLTLVLALAVFLGAGMMFGACNNTPDTTKHKITFMSDNTENAAVIATVYTNGKEEIVLPNANAKLGYNFNGFCYDVKMVSVDAENNPILDGDGNPVTYPQPTQFTKDTFKDIELKEDIVVYADYSTISYNIRYFVDGVEVAQNDPTLTPIFYTISDEALDLPTRTKTGYNFDGWYLTSDYTQRLSVIPAGSTGDLVLYGRFVAE